MEIATLSVPWCDVREDMEFDLAHTICTYTILTVAIIVGLATACDYLQRNFAMIKRMYLAVDKRGYFLEISVLRTTSRLCGKVTDKRIGSLNGLRFISLVMTLIITTLLNFDLDIFKGLFNLLSLPYWTSSQFILHGILYIDTLFLISGITVMYTNIPREDSKDQRFHVIAYILRRLFRIIPTYLFVMACVIVLPNAASGPLWNQIVKNDARLCREHWWKNLLFFNNFAVKTDELCLQESWYVATDLQLYLIALIIIGLIVVWRSPKWAAFVATVLSVAGMLAVGIVTYVYDYFPTVLISSLDLHKVSIYQDVVYHKPHDHIAPFCVGLAVGYMFVKKPKLKIPMITQVSAWAISTALWSSILIGTNPWNRGTGAPSDSLGSVFAATHRFSWAVGITWISVASYYGYGGTINSILSHWLFAPLSRLSFAALLSYTVTYNVVFGYYRTHVDINRVDFVLFAIGFLVMIYVVAYVIYILIDGPTIAIKDMIFYHPRSDANSTFKPPIETVKIEGKLARTKKSTTSIIFNDATFSVSSAKEPTIQNERYKAKENFDYRF